jgi:hypothetical protein
MKLDGTANGWGATDPMGIDSFDHRAQILEDCAATRTLHHAIAHFSLMTSYSSGDGPSNRGSGSSFLATLPLLRIFG